MNEDTSYVSLSLEKYNELYDKAKKYDEMETEKMSDELKDLIYKMYKVANEKSAATEEVVKEFQEGQKVKLISLGDFTRFFKIGDICTIEDLHGDDSEECIQIKSCEHGNIGYVSIDMIEKVNESEEK